MKRNIDTIKKILLAVEQSDQAVYEVKGIQSEDFAFHASLLIDAGFIHGTVHNGPKGVPGIAAVTSLTWAGCEFLDNARNEAVWQKAKDFVKKAGGTASIEVFKFALDFFMKQYLA